MTECLLYSSDQAGLYLRNNINFGNVPSFINYQKTIKAYKILVMYTFLFCELPQDLFYHKQLSSCVALNLVCSFTALTFMDIRIYSWNVLTNTLPLTFNKITLLWVMHSSLSQHSPLFLNLLGELLSWYSSMVSQDLFLSQISTRIFISS